MQATVTAPSLRPSLALFGIEPWRAALEYVSHKLVVDDVQPTGDGHPVIIFPGLGTDGSTVAPLRKYCSSLGYAAMDWGLGRNTGPSGKLDDWLDHLATHVTSLLGDDEQGATLIGWSLGGLYARELGRLMPHRVRQVISIGTPFNADADHTNVGWLYRLLNGTRANIDSALATRLRTPPPVPTTSIYSRSDGIVAWQTCCHADGTHATDIEVVGSHVGLGWNPAVLRVVRQLLAAFTDQQQARAVPRAKAQRQPRH